MSYRPLSPKTLGGPLARHARPALLLVLALVSMPVLAGCLGTGDAPAPQPAASDEENQSNFVNGTVEAPDGRGELAAFEETNRTEMGHGGMEHKHDYWGGQTTATVMEGDWWFIPLPLTPKTGEPAGTAIADLAPDIGKLVPEGTSKLVVTIKIHGPAPPICRVSGNPLPACVVSPVGHPVAKQMGLKYITANDNLGEWRDGGILQDGVPLEIPVAPTEADMPHSTASLWLFRLYTLEPNSIGFNVTVVAHKGYDVVDWPGHPDFYADKPSRVVFDAPVELTYSGFHTFNLYGDDSTWVVPEKLISWGTTRLEVFVNVSEFAMAPGYEAFQPSGWHLDFHNATDQPRITTTDMTMNESYDTGSDGTSYHFTIPLDDAAYDSPYASISRWGFRMLPDVQGENTCTDLCPGFRIKATFTIVAWNDEKLGGAAAPAPAEA